MGINRQHHPPSPLTYQLCYRMAESVVKRSKREHRAARFALEFAGDNNIRDDIKNRLQEIKKSFPDKATNTDILNALIDGWQREPGCIKLDKSAKITNNAAANEEIFLATKSALEHFLNVGSAHKVCQGTISISDSVVDMFANRVKLRCSKGCSQFTKGQEYYWTSSTYGESGNLTINKRILHSFFETGFLPSQFKTFMAVAGIKYQPSALKTQFPKYAGIVNEVSTFVKSAWYFYWGKMIHFYLFW